MLDLHLTRESLFPCKSSSIALAPTLKVCRRLASDSLNIVGDDHRPIGTQHFIQVLDHGYRCTVHPTGKRSLSGLFGSAFDVFDRHVTFQTALTQDLRVKVYAAFSPTASTLEQALAAAPR